MYLSHVYACIFMLRFVVTGTISQSSSRFVLNKLRLYVIPALFVETTRLVVLISEGLFFSGGVGTPSQRFLAVIAVVRTSCLGF